MLEEEEQRGPSWGFAWPVVIAHAVLGFVLFLAVSPFLPGPPEGQANPETVTVIAIGGSFFLGVLLVLASALAFRLSRGAGSSSDLVPAVALGLVGPLVFGVSGSAAWAAAAPFVTREVGAMVVLPALLAGAAAPALALVVGALYLLYEA